MIPDHVEEVLLNAWPAPPARPTVVLYIEREDDGGWWGRTEPVLFIALIEWRRYSRPFEDIEMLDESERLEYFRHAEQRLDVIVYDPSSSTGFSTRESTIGEADFTYSLVTVEAEETWQTICFHVLAAEAAYRRNEARLAKKAGVRGTNR